MFFIKQGKYWGRSLFTIYKYIYKVQIMVSSKIQDAWSSGVLVQLTFYVLNYF